MAYMREFSCRLEPDERCAEAWVGPLTPENVIRSAFLYTCNHVEKFGALLSHRCQFSSARPFQHRSLTMATPPPVRTIEEAERLFEKLEEGFPTESLGHERWYLVAVGKPS